MRVLEMECDGCGRLVRTAKDGDRCGACDVVLCNGCLGGTQRCPSCQRLFASSRDEAKLARHVPTGGPNRVALAAALVIAAGVAFAWLGGGGGPAPAEGTRGLSGGGLGARPPPAGLARQLAAGSPAVTSVTLGAGPCAYSTAHANGVLERTARLRFAPRGPGDLAWALEPVLGALDGQLRPASGATVGPFSEPIGRSEGSRRSHLLVWLDAFLDPVVEAGSARGGQLEGRLYVYDRFEGRVVCGARLVSTLAEPITLSDQGDSLGAARVELVLGALRAGLDELHAVGAPGPGVGMPSRF